MSTATTRLSLMRGDTAKFDITIVDSTTSDALDLTGALGAWFTVKTSRRAPDSSKLIQKTIGDGITLTAAASGQLRLTVSATDMAALSPARLYAWDLQVQTSSGDIITADYLTGTLAVEGDVTRAVA